MKARAAAFRLPMALQVTPVMAVHVNFYEVFA